jgi:uncharacterized protein related to proFAR isomerase
LPLEIPIIYIKDKQAFTKKDGTLRLLGNPVFLAKEYAKQGTKLIHMIDEDAKKGLAVNLDVYDKLTYFINVEVECGEHVSIIKKLLSMKARVVLRLPTKIDLKKWKDRERLLVGIVDPDYQGKAEGVHDVIIEGADEEIIKKYRKLKKRIIVHENELDEFKSRCFGILKSI